MDQLYDEMPDKQRRLTVIPSVVIDQSGSIGHTSNLVSIIPPTHHDRILRCILPEPIVGLSEIVYDVLAPVWVLRSKYDRRRGIGIGRDPRAMHDEENKHSDGIGNDGDPSVDPENPMGTTTLLGR